MKVRQGLLKFISPDTPEELKLKAARCEPLDPPLPPEDQVTLLFVLSHDRNPAISEAAGKSLNDYPAEAMLDALEKKLDPLVIKKILSIHGGNDAISIMAALNEGIDDETLKMLAGSGPEEVVGVLFEEREVFLKKPFLLDALKKNPLTSKSAILEIEEFLANPAKVTGVKKENTPAPQDNADIKALKKDDKDVKVDESNIYKAVKDMSMGQKIKLALCGNKSTREFLVKDSNKIISLAVLKNPRMTEDEVLKLISSKGTPEDLLRYVARNKEWVKNYSIKLGIATNPKTPITMSLKMLDSLLDKDLQKISKSKNVASVLASSARRKVEAKAKK